ncbi:MAG: histidinol-phosphatase [Actinomycetota bacterium]|jgi:histidinol-phosphatase|nr:histidinol-phosphatase [Sporichthyaceae bacterium]MDQ3113093.1 histidinol-phosphatase [Actinomycetota bacterium]
MTTPDFGDDVRFAHTLADAADAVSLERFKALDLAVETKPDLTPVTDADRTIEERIRSALSRSRPRDAVIGEELGASGQSARRWVIDPIDGTKNFVRGVPVWATLIGLMVDDVVVAGVVSAPALDRRWWAARGQGAWSGRSLARASRCKVSDIDTIADASLSYSSLGGWEDAGRLEQFFRLSRRCWRTRGYGDFWSYVLVADGAVDIAAEPALALHDMAAVCVVVEEAGGRFTSLDGVPGPHGGNAVATNGRLHDEVLALLSSDRPPG